jgi:hypothetical protein
MPVQKGKPNNLLAKYGTRLNTAHNKAKDEDTDFGNLGDLPAGISGGVAVLESIEITKIKEGKKNAGEPLFIARAIVISPEQYEGQQCKGMATTIMTVLCDTPERSGERKTFEQHYAWMLNELRKLGIDTRTTKPEDLDGIMDALRISKPQIRFRTWKGEKQTTGQYAGKEPRVNHEWGGLVTDSDSSLNGIGAVDVDPTDIGDANSGAAEAGDDGVADADAAVDLDGLATAADGGDEDAQNQLVELADSVGITEDQIAAAADYVALVAQIQQVQYGETTDEGGWKVGDTCQYAPKDPKDRTGKKRLAKVACELLVINADGTLVELKNLTDVKKKYKDVSINEIEPS